MYHMHVFLHMFNLSIIYINSISSSQAGVKHIILAVSYRAEQMEQELRHLEKKVGTNWIQNNTCVHSW